jgi:hypothetical protein
VTAAPAVPAAAPRLRLREVRCHERAVRLRLPFRFGVITVTRTRQALVRARVALPDGREAWGVAAEALAAKWFDKRPHLSDEANEAQLRASLRLAIDHYTGAGAATAFGLSAATYRAQQAAGAARDLPPLVAGFGPALLDRAVLDALCRLHGVPFPEAVRANLPGLAVTDLTPDLRGLDVDAFLAALRPAPSIHARHTVGLVDPLTAADQPPGTRVGDGLPETLEEVVAAYGHTYFKLKVGGDRAADLARLTAIAAVLDRSPAPYHVTLDGNEQYADLDAVLDLWHALEAVPALRRLLASVLFVEQPIARAGALARDVHALGARRPVVIDESDGDLDAFVHARARGYAGVSSKTCKGLYKSLLNRARCEAWNREAGGPRHFMSGEDLTTQAGVAVQQDLALVALLGLEHVERNGHHYIDGMAAASEREQAAFLAAHPDLYRRDGGPVRLRIAAGRLALGSLGRYPAFATGAEPDWDAIPEME